MEHSISKTNINNSSRIPESNSLDLVDRISPLPDPILGIILSFIPTKNAVASAVLSKRWKLLWTTVQNLDLCYDDRMGKQDERDDMRFVGFVNHVLLLHDVGWLNKFRLVWTPKCISFSSHANSWISTAIKRNVHELFLCLETHTLGKSSFYRHRTSLELFVVPICVFNCNTLRFLELGGSISVSAEIEVCLPKLETIKLVSVYFQEEAFEKLIRGCPVLINLLIELADGMLFEIHEDGDLRYIISSTSLRCLEIRIAYGNYRPLYVNLELEAFSLEYLTLYGVIPVFLVQKSLSSLVKAKLEIDLRESSDFSDADMCNSIVEAVRVFDCAKALILSDHIIRALSCATISLSTEFKRLVKLEAETFCYACSLLQDFIQCSDNLQVLTIKQNNIGPEVDDHIHTNWTAPLQVPRCLSNSLKKVVLDDFYGLKDEREMILYTLKHGSCLEVMEISVHIGRDDAKLELVQEISKLSKLVGGTFECNVKVL